MKINSSNAGVYMYTNSNFVNLCKIRVLQNLLFKRGLNISRITNKWKYPHSKTQQSITHRPSGLEIETKFDLAHMMENCDRWSSAMWSIQTFVSIFNLVDLKPSRAIWAELQFPLSLCWSRHWLGGSHFQLPE